MKAAYRSMVKSVVPMRTPLREVGRMIRQREIGTKRAYRKEAITDGAKSNCNGTPPIGEGNSWVVELVDMSWMERHGEECKEAGRQKWGAGSAVEGIVLQISKLNNQRAHFGRTYAGRPAYGYVSLRARLANPDVESY